MVNRVLTALAKLDAKVDNIKKDTEQIRKDFEQKLQIIDAKLDASIEKVGTLEASVNYAHTSIEKQKTSISQMEKEVKSYKGQATRATEQLTKQTREMADFADQMMEQFNDLERRTRSYNIRVRGVPEGMVVGRLDHRSVVAEILVKNNLVRSSQDEVVRAMEIAHPLGKPIRGKFNLIAKFFARPYRNAIVKAAREHTGDLEGAEKVVEDLTKLDRDRKTRAFPKMKEAYESGKKVRFQNGKLVIDGSVVDIPD